MYRWEQELQDSFLGTATADLWSPKADFDAEQILEECSWADGRADAVWAGIQGELSYCNTRAEVLADPVVSRIVAELHSRAPRTEERLYSVSGVSYASFRSALWQAADAKLAQATSTGAFVLGGSFPTSSVELCAFEFKLRDWNRAFYQALRYRSFAHRVYIVMPPATTHRLIEIADRFRVFGIGLIEHAADGTSHRRILARKQRPRSRPSFMRAIAELSDPHI